MFSSGCPKEFWGEWELGNYPLLTFLGCSPLRQKQLPHFQTAIVVVTHHIHYSLTFLSSTWGFDFWQEEIGESHIGNIFRCLNVGLGAPATPFLKILTPYVSWNPRLFLNFMKAYYRKQTIKGRGLRKKELLGCMDSVVENSRLAAYRR